MWLLLEVGADPDAGAASEATPLYAASEWRREACARLLLQWNGRAWRDTADLLE